MPKKTKKPRAVKAWAVLAGGVNIFVGTYTHTLFRTKKSAREEWPKATIIKVLIKPL